MTIPIRQKSLSRKRVPLLPSGSAAIGGEEVVKRSFDTHLGNIIRLHRGEALVLTIEFTAAPAKAKVVCHTNLRSEDDSWQTLPFKRNGTSYRFSLRAERCGVFGFRVKYSFDGGASWIWDRAPLVNVHVDPSEMKDVRMYTLLPNASGTIDHWIEALDHIKRMNFNMVHLLPVTEMDASESPYSARNLFAFDPSYYDSKAYPDGMDAFEHFVEAVKERHMGLCIDLVLNHIGPGSLVRHKFPEWIMPDRDEPDGMKRSGCWHMNLWLKWKDLVKIDYDHPIPEKREELWSYMKAYALFWANYADYTGGMVRLDNLHNSDEHFISFLLSELRRSYPNLPIQAEFFSDSNTILKRAQQWDINLFLANSWEYPYAENLREYISYIHEISSQIQYFVPVTTHDTGAPAQLFGDARAVVPRYFITALFSSGKTGMVQGAEHAVPGKVAFIGRKRDFPYQLDRWIFDRITRINTLLRKYAFLHDVGNLTFVDGDHGAILAAHRASGVESQPGLLLAANLDTQGRHKLTIDLAALTGQERNCLMDALDPGAKMRVGAAHELVIPPCGIMAYLLWPCTVARLKPQSATPGD